METKCIVTMAKTISLCLQQWIVHADCGYLALTARVACSEMATDKQRDKQCYFISREAPQIWNETHRAIRTSLSLNCFKYHLKTN